MIELASGGILQADAEALVNTVNCVGVMGRGIALQFKNAFPSNYREYRAVCERKQLEPGMMLVHDLRRLTNPRYIINFPTKRHWKGKSRIEDIDAGLRALAHEVRARNIRSIAIPPLGAGLGGLDWRRVRSRIEATFRDFADVRVIVYEPSGAPAPSEMPHASKSPRMTVGRAAVIGLMRRYLAAVMDPFVTLLEVHKLMYFMQEAGEPLKLQYAKGPYGPYAENLRHVLSSIEGHFIHGYGDAEDRPDKAIELEMGAAEQSEEFLREHPVTHQYFAKVVRLIDGFESPFGMELLATVHWVASREAALHVRDAAAKIYAWSNRKRMFSLEHIGVAWAALEQSGWVGTHPRSE